jgi:arylsulfatase A-like enzyme
MKDGPKGEYLTDRLASETVKFIENHKTEPFFVYLPFYSVHNPLEARPDLLKKYEAKRKRLGLGDKFTSEGKYHNNRMNHSLPEYAAMVEAVDQATGRVLDTLKRLGLDDNTIVFFTSDNGGVSTAQGYPTSNAPLRAGKGWLYEGGIREPLIIRWPGVTKPGTVIDTPVIGTDFFPTILDMVGSEPPPDYPRDGVSLAPLLKTAIEPQRKALYWHYPHYADQGGRPGSAIREGKWKLIHFYENDRTELYNLKRDIGEKHNVAEKHPKITKRLTRDLNKWLKDVGAKFPTPNPAYGK